MVSLKDSKRKPDYSPAGFRIYVFRGSPDLFMGDFWELSLNLQ